MDNLGLYFPNCLCKLKYFTIYLRELMLERSEWTVNEKQNWPVLHDLVGITTLACLKNEDFKFIKRTAFMWSTYDDEVGLKDFRLINGQILICTRLKGFPKYINVFLIECIDGDIQLTGQAHGCDDEKHSDCYELKSTVKIPASIHFSPCGGYFMGQPVYLQYDIPRLLKSINEVIDPIREHIVRNWEYTSFIQYIKHIPIILTEKMLGDYETSDEKEMDEFTEDSKYKLRHTNPEKLMFLSPEMCQAQKNSGLILFHYRDNERKRAPCRSSSDSYSPNLKLKCKEFKRLLQPYNLNEELLLNASASDTVLQNLNYLANNIDYY